MKWNIADLGNLWYVRKMLLQPAVYYEIIALR